MAIEEIERDQLLFVLDEPKDEHFFQARVRCVTETGLELEYIGSSSKNQFTAKFRPVFTTKGGKATFKPTKHTNVLEGEILHEHIDALVLAQGLTMNPSGTLTADTVRVAKALLPLHLYQFA